MNDIKENIRKDKINNRVYYFFITFLFVIIILWAFIDVINLIERV